MSCLVQPLDGQSSPGYGARSDLRDGGFQRSAPALCIWDPSDTFCAVTERALFVGMISTVHASVIVQVFLGFVAIVSACSVNAEGLDDLFSSAGHLQSSAATLVLKLNRPRNQGGCFLTNPIVLWMQVSLCCIFLGFFKWRAGLLGQGGARSQAERDGAGVQGLHRSTRGVSSPHPCCIPLKPGESVWGQTAPSHLCGRVLENPYCTIAEAKSNRRSCVETGARVPPEMGEPSPEGGGRLRSR